MATLYKKLKQNQRPMFRAISGAVVLAQKHHGINIDKFFARSVAKRALGTLFAQWREVLAVRQSESAPLATPEESPSNASGGTGYQLVQSGLAELLSYPLGGKSEKNQRRLSSQRRPLSLKRSPLLRLWKRFATEAGIARRNHDESRLRLYQDVLRIIDQEMKTTYDGQTPS